MRRVMLLLPVLCLAFAPVPFPKSFRGDLKQLQGTWELVRSQNTIRGMEAKLFDEPIRGMTWTIKGNRLGAGTIGE